jgi:hypothetical protein
MRWIALRLMEAIMAVGFIAIIYGMSDSIHTAEQAQPITVEPSPPVVDLSGTYCTYKARTVDTDQGCNEGRGNVTSPAPTH